MRGPVRPHPIAAATHTPPSLSEEAQNMKNNVLRIGTIASLVMALAAPAVMPNMVFAQVGDVPQEGRREDRQQDRQADRLADRGRRGRSIRSFNDKRGSQRPSRASRLLH